MKPKPRRTRAQACGTKKRHPDKAEAEKHRDRLVRRGASPDTLLVYRCPYCRAHHVGHAVPDDR